MTDTADTNDQPGPAPVEGTPVTGSSRRSDAPQTAADGPTGTDTPPGAPEAAQGDPGGLFGPIPDGLAVEIAPEALAAVSLVEATDLATPGGPRCAVLVDVDGDERTVEGDSLGDALAQLAPDQGEERTVTVLLIEEAETDARDGRTGVEIDAFADEDD